MSAATAVPRRAGRSPESRASGAAVPRALLRLVGFTAAVLAFLLVPLVTLGVAFLVYTVLRHRGESQRTEHADVAATGFGSGAR